MQNISHASNTPSKLPHRHHSRSPNHSPPNHVHRRPRSAHNRETRPIGLPGSPRARTHAFHRRRSRAPHCRALRRARLGCRHGALPRRGKPRPPKGARAEGTRAGTGCHFTCGSGSGATAAASHKQLGCGEQVALTQEGKEPQEKDVRYANFIVPEELAILTHLVKRNWVRRRNLPLPHLSPRSPLLLIGQ